MAHSRCARLVLRLAAVVLFLATGPLPAELVSLEPLSLERILSAPFPEGLVASEATGAVAWVMNAAGRRNLWIAEPPAYQGRQLTRYAEDDGIVLRGLAFSRDGKSLFYVRGEGPNTARGNPNPAGIPEGTEEAIWQVAVGGGAPRRLVTGSAPLPAPDGRRLLYSHHADLWQVALEAKKGEKAEGKEVFTLTGGNSELALSPDGGRVAFASHRGRHSFVGVFDFAGRRLTWLDPGLGSDLAPTWSPDGKEVAFLRLAPDEEEIPFLAHPAGPPWSLRIADATTGESREIFRAAPGDGSVFQGIAAANQLLWADDGRLVFPWERDGWLHLYAVSSTGGTPILLTPGDFEVESAVLASDRKSLLVSSNQGDLDRRHLWRIPLTGEPPFAGKPERLTAGNDIEWYPTPVRGGAVAFFRSTARQPAQPVILLAGEAAPRELAPGTLPADFPLASLVEPQAVTVPASDGLPLHGQLFLPPGSAPTQRRPALVFFHGGSRRQMLLGWHYLDYYHNAYALNQLLASRGFVVLALNYRSGIGYGLRFREAAGYGAGGASELNDVLGAGLYLAGRPDVDPRRIGLWGGSYGGYLTAMGLARASDLFAAGVDFHGVHDWNVVIRNHASSYDPLARPEVARLAFASSPMASLDTWRSPVLLIHGDDDPAVPFTESIDLAIGLRRRGVEVEELAFPDEAHDFLLHRSWLRAYRATIEFFERRLMAP